MKRRPKGWQSRSAIISALYRHCRAIDRGDWELLRTVYHDDAKEHHGRFDGQASEFVDYARASTNPATVSQHHLTTINVDLRGDVAHTEAYFICPILLPAAEDGTRQIKELLGRYIDRFEVRKGEWRIVDRTVVIDMLRFHDASQESLDGFLRGSSDRTDPSYQNGVSLIY